MNYLLFFTFRIFFILMNLILFNIAHLFNEFYHHKFMLMFKFNYFLFQFIFINYTSVANSIIDFNNYFTALYQNFYLNHLIINSIMISYLIINFPILCINLYLIDIIIIKFVIFHLIILNLITIHKFYYLNFQ